MRRKRRPGGQARQAGLGGGEDSVLNENFDHYKRLLDGLTVVKTVSALENATERDAAMKDALTAVEAIATKAKEVMDTRIAAQEEDLAGSRAMVELSPAEVELERCIDEGDIAVKRGSWGSNSNATTQKGANHTRSTSRARRTNPSRTSEGRGPWR